MIIDAMDLLYTKRFDGFCLSPVTATSLDSLSNQKEGLLVYGFGERRLQKPLYPPVTNSFSLKFSGLKRMSGQPRNPKPPMN